MAHAHRLPSQPKPPALEKSWPNYDKNCTYTSKCVLGFHPTVYKNSSFTPNSPH